MSKKELINEKNRIQRKSEVNLDDIVDTIWEELSGLPEEEQDKRILKAHKRLEAAKKTSGEPSHPKNQW